MTSLTLTKNSNLASELAESNKRCVGLGCSRLSRN
jgi:hypothetical protein